MWWILFLFFGVGDGLKLVAYISSGGLHGEIYFDQNSSGNSIKIQTALKTTLQFPEQQWLWFVTTFPVDYTKIQGRCANESLGQPIIDLTELTGPLVFPGNESFALDISNIDLTGEKTLWNKGLILKDTYSSRIICASIVLIDKRLEKNAQVRFTGHLGGSIWFRFLNENVKSSTSIDASITINLYHTKNQIKGVDFTEHSWKIYLSDTFYANRDINNCNTLQTIFNPDGLGIGKSIGDIDNILNKIKIPVRPNDNFKVILRNEMLLSSAQSILNSHRSLYLVIFDAVHENSPLACGKITHQRPLVASTLINSHGVKGTVTFEQTTPFHPTWINVSLVPVNILTERLLYETRIAFYRIHELPKDPKLQSNEPGVECFSTKSMYNPFKIEIEKQPPPGLGTQDQYALGDLSGKLQSRVEGFHHNDILNGSAKLNGLYWDTYLPLSGIYSIHHRSLVLHLYNKSNDIIPLICGTLFYQSVNNDHQISMRTAEISFRYPIVGKIILRQPENHPEMDTTVIIEGLIYSDGSSVNNSQGHRWMIHDNPPGKDYYNWTGRCLSAGAPYNPYEIQFDPDKNFCSTEHPVLCRMGDLSRLDTLKIAGKRLEGPQWSRRMFTDSFLPISGPYNILGKSLVIYDDHKTALRGERLACAIIGQTYRRKAVIKDWFGNGKMVNVKGKLEFIQQSEYDKTDVEINFKGLNKESVDYRIHTVPVEPNLEFPCEAATLYDTFNPLNISEKSIKVNPGEGTYDQYKVGDLSGKFGTLENKNEIEQAFNDTFLPLFGYSSIIGRSLVVYKKNKIDRWFCSTIERGYSPSEARELRAIASFHHPDGFAYGYIKMSQLVYTDNTLSDTVIEVKLKHPGDHDRNITRNHKWAIFVNPVSVDATVRIQNTRCVAGGYVWDPYFIQLADPLNRDLYKEECGPDQPFRCHVGDLYSRLGPINIGVERKVFIDSNVPLGGSISVLGRSVVIFDKNFGSEKFACANIEPDNDIVKYANIRKPPRFVIAQFLEDIRQIMGIPEWMLSIDSRKTKIVRDGECIQFLIHFRGPIAHRLEQDFSRLLSTGKLASPSLQIPGYIHNKRKKSIPHRQCGSSNRRNLNSGSNLKPLLIIQLYISIYIYIYIFLF